MKRRNFFSMSTFGFALLNSSSFASAQINNSEKSSQPFISHLVNRFHQEPVIRMFVQLYILAKLTNNFKY